MKHIIAIVFLSFSSLLLGQSYFPFPDSVGVWRETAGYDDGINSFENHYSLFLNGDTIIASNKYSKMYVYGSNATPIIDTNNSTYYGALREVNKRVYFLPDSNLTYGFCEEANLAPNAPNYNTELLLYDFNVVVGDTVHYFHMDSSYLVITSIDSIWVQNAFRKRYHFIGPQNTNFNCGAYSTNYVEGIGDVENGLFGYWMSYFENYQFLRCYEDDKVLFSTPKCAWGVGLDEEEKNHSLDIQPNPTSGKLSISLEEGSAKSITIRNSLGQLVLTEKHLPSSLLELDISAYPTGIYFLQVETDEQLITKKIIKN